MGLEHPNPIPVPESIQQMFRDRAVKLNVRSDKGAFIGSGFMLDTDYILTAAHDLGDNPLGLKEIKMRKHFKDFQWRKLQVVATLPDDDLALCKVRYGWFSGPKATLAPLFGPDLDSEVVNKRRMGETITEYPVYSLFPEEWRWFFGYTISMHTSKAITIGREDGDNKSRKGDSGTIILTENGRISTVLVRASRRSSDGSYYDAHGVWPEVIHTFLAAHWPNYQG